MSKLVAWRQWAQATCVTHPKARPFLAAQGKPRAPRSGTLRKAMFRVWADGQGPSPARRRQDLGEWDRESLAGLPRGIRVFPNRLWGRSKPKV
jgi:hypothetical protein